MAVSSFAGDTSCSTYSGDLLCTVRTEGGQLLPLSDTSSALVVPDAKRPLWSVRYAQLAGREIVLGAKPGLLLQGNPRYFVPFINCPETGLWLIRLLPPPTLHNRIYPIHPATNSGRPPCRQVPVSQDDGITPPTSKRLKPITCPVCIAKVRRANRPTPSRGSAAANRPTEPWQDVYTDLSGKVRTASVTGVEYFAVFVDSYLGSKHVEFSPPKTTSSLATNASSPTSDDNQKRFALIKALFNKELWKHIPRYWWMCHASGVRRDAADAPLRRSRHD